MLTLTNIKKTFQQGTPNEYTALNGISLHLPQGDFVTIIGSNGAGKSTLFSAIAGSLRIDSGKIVLDKQDITWKKEHLRAKKIGRLFQDPQMGTAPNLTIEENMAMVYAKASERFMLLPAVFRADKASFREMLASLDMGLESRMHTKVGLLSGGQRQALTLLLATMVPPDLLLLDEHTAALDPVTAEKIMSLTEAIARRHQITTLMITHNIRSALSVGTRTLMMDKGRVIMDISGAERATMSVGDLLAQYRETTHQDLDNDRILLSGKEA